MREFLGEIDLRNTHRVYLDGADYLEESQDGRGQLHTVTVTQETVDFLRASLGGETVSAADAADTLEGVASQLGLPYTYGHKLQFYAQSVLLVLVALGEAEVEKTGRSYQYTVR